MQPQVSPSDQEDMTRKDLVSTLYLSVDGGVRGRPGAGSREGSRQRGLAGKAWPGSHSGLRQVILTSMSFSCLFGCKKVITV